MRRGSIVPTDHLDKLAQFTFSLSQRENRKSEGKSEKKARVIDELKEAKPIRTSHSETATVITPCSGKSFKLFIYHT